MPYLEVETDSGVLRGIDNAGTVSLLGVPYGASTAGANRFRPPQPVAPWTGVRDALTFGPSAPQVDTRSHARANGPRTLSLLYPRAGWPAEGSAIDEDCLRLNVWAPSGHLHESLPVLVWLHGGGFTHGSGNEMAFNGDVLAQFGQLVVVTVTHRLGVTGFLDLREQGVPGSANAGMLDIVAALEWVRRNIASVGGDPDRVTICGQSGGSAKVATLFAMPAARPLFARGIMMSGPMGETPPAAAAVALREHVFELLGVATAEEARSLPLERLLGAQAQILAAGTARFGARPMASIPGFGPSYDPSDLPESAFAAEATDAVAGKQLMIGWATHEAGLLLVDEAGYSTSMTADQAIALLDEDEPGDGRDVYAALARAYPHEPPHLLWSRRLSERIMAGPARTIADLASDKAAGVWAYQFQQPTEVLGGLLGACHSLDLAYVFGTVDRIPLTGRNPARIDVSRAMMRAWATFARDGAPDDGRGPWQPWTRDQHVVHCFGTAYGPELALPPDVDLTVPDLVASRA